MRGDSMRLLLSCRDANGAHQIVPLVREARRRGWAHAVVADGPAMAILQSEGIAATEAAIGEVAQTDQAGQLAARRRANALLREAAPDALIAASSGPGGGIDEALVAMRDPATSFVLQDSWGDVNEVFGARAGHYFVLDDEAASLTRKRVDAHIVVSGMPKYDAYTAFDLAGERSRLRRAIAVGGEATAISFFAQPLAAIAGYADLVRCVIDAVGQMEGEPHFILRAHPKDTASAVEEARQRAEALGVPCSVLQEGRPESILAASDIVISAYSTCCYDAIVLGALAAMPHAPAVYFMTEPVWKVYRASTKLDRVPPVHAGMALLARTERELREHLGAARDPQVRRELWQRSRVGLPLAGAAAQRILDSVAASVACAKAASLPGVSS